MLHIKVSNAEFLAYLTRGPTVNGMYGKTDFEQAYASSHYCRDIYWPYTVAMPYTHRIMHDADNVLINENVILYTKQIKWLGPMVSSSSNKLGLFHLTWVFKCYHMALHSSYLAQL